MDQKHKFSLYMPPISTIASYKEMVDYACAHGITKLETLNILDLATPDLQVAKDLKTYADSKGITFPCVSVGINLVDEDQDAAIETLKQYATCAPKSARTIPQKGTGARPASSTTVMPLSAMGPASPSQTEEAAAA